MPTITISKLISKLGEKKALTIEDFCKTWIPKLYKVSPQEYGYRKACVTELVRLTQGVASSSSIYSNWKWSDGATDYPDYVKAILILAHQKYSTLEALDALPDYSKSME